MLIHFVCILYHIPPFAEEESAVADEDAGEAAAGNISETADGRDRSRRGVRHLPAREEARDMKRDIWRDGRDKGGDGVYVGI